VRSGVQTLSRLNLSSNCNFTFININFTCNCGIVVVVIDSVIESDVVLHTAPHHRCFNDYVIRKVALALVVDMCHVISSHTLGLNTANVMKGLILFVSSSF